MRHPHTDRILAVALAILCSLLAPAAFAASAGVVVNQTGSASILSADGKTRLSPKGASLNPGDTAITGKEGQLDIRFSDGAMVQLRPQSQFRVDEYVYHGKPDGNEKGFFSLLKGSMRALTGMIGKINRPAYAVVTPAATIGIRGTEYMATLKEAGLHVNVMRGEISLTNRAGSFAVSEGQGALVRNSDSAPSYFQAEGASRNGDAKPGTAGKTQIRGNTRIDASTQNASATATGQHNTSTNRAGVIGGD